MNFLNTAILAISAAAVAAIFMAKYKHFFEWKKNDDLKKYVKTAMTEHEKDNHASRMMFGSVAATRKANIILIILMIIILASFAFPNFRTLLFLYLSIGFFVSRRRATDTKTEDYNRLLFQDKFKYYLYFSCVWPLGILSKTK